MSKIQANQIQHTQNGAAVFTLPTSDGSANQLLKTDGSGTLSFVDSAAGGKVLQVVNSLSSTATTINATTTYTDTGITDSITTTAANSTILVLGSMAYDTARDNNDCGARIRLIRTISGSSSAFMEGGDKNVGAYAGNTNHVRIYGQYPINFHDSGLSSIAAGTTITYKMQARTENTNLNEDIRINNGSKFSTLILMEISA
tara:strand:- start:66 stop:668 length:603 start_codon:yes stop_codon:yes gene_type:complete